MAEPGAPLAPPEPPSTEGRGNSQAVLSFLRIFAILIALVVGIYGEAKYLKEYHRLGRGASYFNVIPSEPAAGKYDATIIKFADDTVINPDQVYGFVDKFTSLVFCVVPILRPTNVTGPNVVHYWATGINCCEPRQNFHCGQVTEDKATGAVRLTQADRNDERFMNAVIAAEKEYGLTHNDKYLLLDVVEDPIGYRRSLHSRTGILFLIFGAAYFVVSVLIGVGLDSSCIGLS